MSAIETLFVEIQEDISEYRETVKRLDCQLHRLELKIKKLKDMMPNIVDTDKLVLELPKESLIVEGPVKVDIPEGSGCPNYPDDEEVPLNKKSVEELIEKGLFKSDNPAHSYTEGGSFLGSEESME